QIFIATDLQVVPAETPAVLVHQKANSWQYFNWQNSKPITVQPTVFSALQLQQLAPVAQKTAVVTGLFQYLEGSGQALPCSGAEVLLGLAGPDQQQLHLDFSKDYLLLIVGSTGSGKSELLRLIVGQLLGNNEQAAQLLLIDYKGGATFQEF